MTAKQLIDEINTASSSRKYDECEGAYIVSVDGMKGVALEVEKGVLINECFNNVCIRNMQFDIDGKVKEVVFLYSKNANLPESFGAVCLDFLNVDKSDEIKANPLKWFEEWSELLGNSRKHQMIFDVIGEMAVLLELQKKGLQPAWDSTTKGTIDISTTFAMYEVKTTTNKTNEYITIHNQFQLDTEGLGKDLYIAFVKVEKNGAGESIDSLYNDLVNNGFDKRVLDKYLQEKGYYVGKKERMEQYVIHEKRLYLVDEHFPRIVKESFVDGKIPQGVISYQYTISLSGLEYSIL